VMVQLSGGMEQIGPSIPDHKASKI
jgi:hypothetical protein